VPSAFQNNFFAWTKTQVSLEDEEESEDPFMVNTKVAFYEIWKINFQIRKI
jgi:hypothetical protein